MKNPTTRKNDIVVQEVSGETLIYDLKSNKAYCLNETSALIWQLCDGKRTASEISDEMSIRVKAQISEDFVWIALDQLNKDGLLEGEISDRFVGLSRREVIRKTGFASVVVLPLVSSLVAPNAANAQSGGMPLLSNCSTCTSGSQCTSTRCVNVTPFTGAQVCVPTSNAGIAGETGFVSANPCNLDCVTFASRTCCSGAATFSLDIVNCAMVGLPLGGCTCD